MKTEMQIIEHLQAQAKAKEDQFKYDHLSAQQLDQWKKQQQVLHPPQPQQMQHLPDVQLVNVTSNTKHRTQPHDCNFFHFIFVSAFFLLRYF